MCISATVGPIIGVLQDAVVLQLYRV